MSDQVNFKKTDFAIFKENFNSSLKIISNKNVSNRLCFWIIFSCYYEKMIKKKKGTYFAPFVSIYIGRKQEFIRFL